VRAGVPGDQQRGSRPAGEADPVVKYWPYEQAHSYLQAEAQSSAEGRLQGESGEEPGNCYRVASS
jgi:hypothetical protein